ncbi:hypothetical protein M8J75_001672 [Diaphorina citri]|nr:hypothetical protein M8J75_001672 [Diaphorina citri]KAI5704069.1 hypothetical protein M8J75_001672 [Diaphorina citri]
MTLSRALVPCQLGGNGEMSRTKICEANLTMEIAQLLLSLLHAWGLDPDLDKVCEGKLGLLRPMVPVSFGVVSKAGHMSLMLPTWQLCVERKEQFSTALPVDSSLPPELVALERLTRQFTAQTHWELSTSLTTNHLISIISLSSTLMSMNNASFVAEQERNRKLQRGQSFRNTANTLQKDEAVEEIMTAQQAQIKQGWSLLATLHCILFYSILRQSFRNTANTLQKDEAVEEIMTAQQAQIKQGWSLLATLHCILFYSILRQSFRNTANTLQKDEAVEEIMTAQQAQIKQGWSLLATLHCILFYSILRQSFRNTANTLQKDEAVEEIMTAQQAQIKQGWSLLATLHCILFYFILRQSFRNTANTLQKDEAVEEIMTAQQAQIKQGWQSFRNTANTLQKDEAVEEIMTAQQAQIKQGWSLLATLHCILLPDKVREAAQALLLAELGRIGSKGRKALVDYWAQYLPVFQPSETANTGTTGSNSQTPQSTGPAQSPDQMPVSHEDEEDEEEEGVEEFSFRKPSSASELKRKQTTAVVLMGVIGAEFGQDVSLDTIHPHLQAIAYYISVIFQSSQFSFRKPSSASELKRKQTTAVVLMGVIGAEFGQDVSLDTKHHHLQAIAYYISVIFQSSQFSFRKPSSASELKRKQTTAVVLMGVIGAEFGQDVSLDTIHPHLQAIAYYISVIFQSSQFSFRKPSSASELKRKQTTAVVLMGVIGAEFGQDVSLDTKHHHLQAIAYYISVIFQNSRFVSPHQPPS